MESVMATIELASTGRTTSRLGYGCSSVMAAMGRRQSLALLEIAFDQGIRHFDVAPLYGYGEAEACLGDFLAGHRGEVTVATKFGLAPAKTPRLLRLGRRWAGPVLQRMPALKRRLARSAGAIAGVGPPVAFTAAEARLSLERSLRALRSGHIDLWLLHEAEARDLGDDGLLRFLEDSVASGKVRTFGVGSEAAKIPLLLSQRREYCRVLQFEWSVLDAALPLTDAFRIHHGAVARNFRALHDSIRKDAARRARWSQVVGADLRDASVVAALMLSAALNRNPGSIVLFSSRNAKHVQNNVRSAADPSLVEPALRFHDLIRTEWVQNARAQDYR